MDNLKQHQDDMVQSLVALGVPEEKAWVSVRDLIQAVTKKCYANFFAECKECPLKKDDEDNPIDWEAKLNV